MNHPRIGGNVLLKTNECKNVSLRVPLLRGAGIMRSVGEHWKVVLEDRVINVG